MKRLRAVFALTVAEQRVVISLLSLFVALAAVKHYRDAHLSPLPATVQPSPSPGILP